MSYQAVRGIGADELVAALELDHQRLLDRVEQLEQTEDPLEAALLSRAFIVLFALRMEKEYTIILPAPTADGVDVTPALDPLIVQMTTEHGSHFLVVYRAKSCPHVFGALRLHAQRTNRRR